MGAAFVGCRISNRVAFLAAYIAPHHFFEVGIPLSSGYGVIPLREYWHDPNLNDGERFLRDYILDQKHKEPQNRKTYVVRVL